MKRPHAFRHRGRGGYTLAELLTVIVIAGIMAAIAVPRLSNVLRHYSSRSALSQVMADLALARTQAVREGRTVSLRVTGSGTYQVTVDNGTAILRTLKTVDVSGSQRNVTVTPSDAIVSFDTRGMLRTGSAGRLIVTRGGMSDSVSISAVGRVYRGND
ncbi:MAG TPA: GspH/FimT family pseudopilin [Longimicrobium sp.]|nr:GspH/FimT family pseudopilin [Longimicrobium sp.]